MIIMRRSMSHKAILHSWIWWIVFSFILMEFKHDAVKVTLLWIFARLHHDRWAMYRYERNTKMVQGVCGVGPWCVCVLLDGHYMCRALRRLGHRWRGNQALSIRFLVITTRARLGERRPRQVTRSSQDTHQWLTPPGHSESQIQLLLVCVALSVRENIKAT